jgi:hypothetical protein
MPETREPPSTHGKGREQLDHLIAQVNRLVLRYQQREASRPEDTLAGGSRSVLTNLLRDAEEWLATGAIKDSVVDVVQRRKDAPPEPLRVSDELDLLQAVAYELEAVAKKLHIHHPLAGSPSEVPTDPPLSTQYHSGMWDEGPSGPTLPQHHRKQARRKSQDGISTMRQPEFTVPFV